MDALEEDCTDFVWRIWHGAKLGGSGAWYRLSVLGAEPARESGLVERKDFARLLIEVRGSIGPEAHDTPL